MPIAVVRSSSFIFTGRMSVSGDAWEGDAEITFEVMAGVSGSGETPDTTNAASFGDGSARVAVEGTTPPAAAPADGLTRHLSEDVWEGHEDFVVHINGAAITMPQMVTPPAKLRRPQASPSRLT